METKAESSKGSCKLCEKHHQHMSTPAQWRNKRVQELATKLDISDEDMVCQLYRQDISKMISTPNHTPRWKKTVEHKQCCVSKCPDKLLITTKHLNLYHGLFAYVKSSTIWCTRWLSPIQTHCITCGMLLKHTNPKTCPSPQVCREAPEMQY